MIFKWMYATSKSIPLFNFLFMKKIIKNDNHFGWALYHDENLTVANFLTKGLEENKLSTFQVI